MCGELGLGADLASMHVKGTESVITGGMFVDARAMVRLPMLPWVWRLGIDAEAGGSTETRVFVVLGGGVRW